MSAEREECMQKEDLKKYVYTFLSSKKDTEKKR